jgi:hypothetical protein
MEMQELEAVLHAPSFQFLESAKDFADGQAELRAIATRRLPAPSPSRGQLDSHADGRTNAGLLGIFENQVELGVFLDDRNDPAADLVRHHRHLDEFGVLEAVADDRRVVVRERDDGEQLRFGPGLQAELILASELQDLLDDLPLLIDLDGVHADVPAAVLVLRDGGLKRVVNVLQTVRENVAKANQRRQTDAPEFQVADELLEIDGAERILRRMDLDLAVVTDREVPLAPFLDFIELGGIGHRPGIADFMCGAQPRHRMIHDRHMISVFFPEHEDAFCRRRCRRGCHRCDDARVGRSIDAVHLVLRAFQERYAANWSGRPGGATSKRPLIVVAETRVYVRR